MDLSAVLGAAYTVWLSGQRPASRKYIVDCAPTRG